MIIDFGPLRLAGEGMGGYTQPMRRFVPAVLFLLLLSCKPPAKDEVPADGGGAVGSCQASGRACRSSADCCGVLLCNANKVCGDGNCQGTGTACTSSSQCCGLLTCSGGVCGGGSLCQAQGAACSGSSQCCGTLTCSGGLCR